MCGDHLLWTLSRPQTLPVDTPTTLWLFATRVSRSAAQCRRVQRLRIASPFRYSPSGNITVIGWSGMGLSRSRAPKRTRERPIREERPAFGWRRIEWQGQHSPLERGVSEPAPMNIIGHDP